MIKSIDDNKYYSQRMQLLVISLKSGSEEGRGTEAYHSPPSHVPETYIQNFAEFVITHAVQQHIQTGLGTRPSHSEGLVPRLYLRLVCELDLQHLHYLPSLPISSTSCHTHLTMVCTVA